MTSSTTEDPYALTLNQERQMADLFKHLEQIKKIAYSKRGSVVKLLIVHQYDDITGGLEKISDVTLGLDDLLPDYYETEPLILHESEMRDSLISGSKIILSR